MFSRALDNARALLTRSPSSSSLRDPHDAQSAHDRAPSPTPAAMVTTRGGADTNSPVASSVTRSGRKRLVDDSAQSTPTRAAKKRRSSAEEQDQEAAPKLDFGRDSAASASDSAQGSHESGLSVSTPIRGRGRGMAPKDAAPETPMAGNREQKPEQGTADAANLAAEVTPHDGESVYGTPAGDDSPSSVYATPATTLRHGLRGATCPCPPPASVTPKPRARATRSTPSKPSRLASSQTVEEDIDMFTPKAEEPKAEEPTPEESAPAPKNTHIRFGSEDPPAIPEPVPEPSAQQEIPSSTAEQEEDSDDEAPEAVTATSAREQARAAEEDAAKAVEKQESEAKRKRQEREARLREQATAAKKRKQDLAPPKEIPADVASSTTIQASDPSAFHRRTKTPACDLNNIPALLPADLLAAAPDVRPATPEPEEADSAQADAAARKREKLNKHLKFLDEKPAKDLKKGPVRVRVLEKGNKFLPPKVMSNGSKSVRDTWLQGRKIKETNKGSFGGLERKRVGGGFLRK